MTNLLLLEITEVYHERYYLTNLYVSPAHRTLLFINREYLDYFWINDTEQYDYQALNPVLQKIDKKVWPYCQYLYIKDEDYHNLVEVSWNPSLALLYLNQKNSCYWTLIKQVIFGARLFCATSTIRILMDSSISVRKKSV